MREIKFRIWDCDTGEYVREGWHIGHKIYANRDIQSPDPFGEILEQYTGLKDKNGREIYEGDIVKRVSAYGPYILFVVWNDIAARYEATPRIGACGEDVGGEIIGNIHENPELLK